MFFLGKKNQKETMFDILESKERLSHLKSEVLKEVQKIHILQRG